MNFLSTFLFPFYIIIRSDRKFFLIANIALLVDNIFIKFYREDLLVTILFLFYFVLIINFQLITTIPPFLKKKKYFIYSFFTTLNIFVFKLLDYQDFSEKNIFIQLLIFSFIFFLLFFIFNNLYTKKIKKFIFIIFLIPISSIVLFLHSDYLNKNEYIKKEFFNKNDFVFKEKPNVFLIGIDSLAPEFLLKKLVNKKIGFDHEILKDIFYFKNGFGYRGTFRTWSTILSLGFYERPWFGWRGMYSGAKDMPLFKIFRNNGYKIYTGFENTYFGKHKDGPYVDDFRHPDANNYTDKNIYTDKNNYANKIKNSLSCMTSSRSFLIFHKYFGFCNLFHDFFIEQNSKEQNSIEQNINISPKEFLFNYLNDIYKVENPKLFLYHFLYMRHAMGDFQKKTQSEKANWLNDFYNNFNRQKNTLILFINYIKKNDPNAIVLFFGDHGVYLASDVDDFPIQSDKSKDTILDGYANQIFMLKTDNKCAKENLNFVDDYNLQYKIVAGIIDCLSEGQNILTEDFFKKNQSLNTILDFKNYLYE